MAWQQEWQNLEGAAALVYKELLNQFGSSPVDLSAVSRAAVTSFAQKHNVTDPSLVNQVTNMVLAIAIHESGVRPIPAEAPGEASYGVFQLNTGGKGAGYTPDALLNDSILNIVIAADYLVRAALVSPAGTAAPATFDPNAAAYRMVVEEQAPLGWVTLSTGQPQAKETQANVDSVRKHWDDVTQSAGSGPGAVPTATRHDSS